MGSSPHSPAITIKRASENYIDGKFKPIDIKNSKSIEKLSAAIQAVPSLLVANEASQKTLMEVVINGDLVRAADGNGFRAYAMNGDKKISEHARLFETRSLDNLIDAAAIWQVASVVVAQKHLADISKKLDEIKDGIAHISEFLDNQRKARIKSAFDYAYQVYFSINEGEISDSSKVEIERCERDLIEIQNHLEMEFKQKVDKKVEHSETWGTEQLTKDMGKKIENIGLLSEDIAMCIKIRIVIWHILSLLNTNYQYKSRQESILRAIQSYSDLSLYLDQNITNEVENIKSMWNKNQTLYERKHSLIVACEKTKGKLDEAVNNNIEYIKKREQCFFENAKPIRMLLAFDGDNLVSASQENEFSNLFNVTPPTLQPVQ